MKPEFKKNDNKRNFKNNNRKNYDNRDNKPKDENEYDDIVEGRNAVLELLNSDRDINKIFVQSGERHGSINKIIAMKEELKVSDLMRMILKESGYEEMLNQDQTKETFLHRYRNR